MFLVLFESLPGIGGAQGGLAMFKLMGQELLNIE
jgi:hypothetical protein